MPAADQRGIPAEKPASASRASSSSRNRSARQSGAMTCSKNNRRCSADDTLELGQEWTAAFRLTPLVEQEDRSKNAAPNPDRRHGRCRETRPAPPLRAWQRYPRNRASIARTLCRRGRRSWRRGSTNRPDAGRAPDRIPSERRRRRGPIRRTRRENSEKDICSRGPPNASCASSLLSA